MLSNGGSQLAEEDWNLLDELRWKKSLPLNTAAALHSRSS